MLKEYVQNSTTLRGRQSGYHPHFTDEQQPQEGYMETVWTSAVIPVDKILK